MITVTKLFEFEAAHHLPDYDGKCSKLHGHTYKLEVEVKAPVGRNGMVVDFSLIKSLISIKVLDFLDHSNLNDFMKIPTAEHTLIWILEQIKDDIDVVRIRLWETSNSYAEWRAE